MQHMQMDADVANEHAEATRLQCVSERKPLDRVEAVDRSACQAQTSGRHADAPRNQSALSTLQASSLDRSHSTLAQRSVQPDVQQSILLSNPWHALQCSDEVNAAAQQESGALHIRYEALCCLGVAIHDSLLLRSSRHSIVILHGL